MRTYLSLFTLVLALVPTLAAAESTVTLKPGYRCHYRDARGECMNYTYQNGRVHPRGSTQDYTYEQDNTDRYLIRKRCRYNRQFERERCLTQGDCGGYYYGQPNYGNTAICDDARYGHIYAPYGYGYGYDANRYLPYERHRYGDFYDYRYDYRYRYGHSGNYYYNQPYYYGNSPYSYRRNTFYDDPGFFRNYYDRTRGYVGDWYDRFTDDD